MNKLTTLTLAAAVALSGAAMGQTTWYVDGNCPNPPGDGSIVSPFCLIQDGINAAADGDTVLVLPGTYHEMIDFIGKAITLRSVGGAGTTIIDADGVGTVVTCDNTAGNYMNGFPTLDGFTITHGAASNGYGGGGMWNYAASPTVYDCVFVNNDGAARGGGMLNQSGSDPEVRGCEFRTNTAQGGGGISNEGSSPFLAECLFEGNTTTYGGAGLRNEQGSSPTVLNCRFQNNDAGVGGGVFNLSDSNPLIVNCMFRDNVATSASSSSGGGGAGMISEDNCSPTLINCTFFGNESTGAGLGGGMFSSNCSPTVINGIFWENSDGGGTGELTQIHHDGSGTTSVEYSCIEGLDAYVGDGNIGDDPLLTADGHLSPGSPCIDAGDTSVLPAGLFVDLDGNGRVLDDVCTYDTGIPAMLIPVTVDMGAYEYHLRGDLDKDGDVDLSDLAELLAHYGVTCTDGEYYNGHYYMLTDPGTWEEAEQQAVAAGGHLVTVNDAAENQWLRDTFGPYGSPGNGWWIGLYQDTSDPGYSEPADGWKWISGEVVTFLGWTGQEPNDLGGGEDWAHLELDNPPQWNDLRQADPPPLPGIIEIGS